MPSVYKEGLLGRVNLTSKPVMRPRDMASGVTEVPVGSTPWLSRYFIISSDRIGVLLCSSLGLMEAMIHPRFPELLKASSSLMGLSQQQAAEIIGSIHMGLFTSLYLTMVNAISGNVLAQRAQSTRADIRVVVAQDCDEMVWAIEEELSNAIHPVDKRGNGVLILSFLESQIATMYDTIENVRESPAIETARLLVWLMRAMKPDKSPGAQANDRSRVRAFCQQLQIHITVPDFPAGTQELLNSAYNFVLNNHGPLVLGALRVTAVRGEVMVAKVATIYLQLIHKSHEFGFRFTYAVIVSTHKDVMSHKTMRQSTLAFHQFLRDYVEIAESAEAQGDAGWYAYLRTLHNKQRMSFSDLARECKVLYALADRIQQATVKHDDTKVWMGFKDARKEIDEALIEELYTMWVAGEEADDGVLKSLYG